MLSCMSSIILVNYKNFANSRCLEIPIASGLSVGESARVVLSLSFLFCLPFLSVWLYSCKKSSPSRCSVPLDRRSRTVGSERTSDRTPSRELILISSLKYHCDALSIYANRCWLFSRNRVVFLNRSKSVLFTRVNRATNKFPHDPGMNAGRK